MQRPNPVSNNNPHIPPSSNVSYAEDHALMNQNNGFGAAGQQDQYKKNEIIPVNADAQLGRSVDTKNAKKNPAVEAELQRVETQLATGFCYYSYSL